jgi:hypothetical protein
MPSQDGKSRGKANAFLKARPDHKGRTYLTTSRLPRVHHATASRHRERGVLTGRHFSSEIFEQVGLGYVGQIQRKRIDATKNRTKSRRQYYGEMLDIFVNPNVIESGKSSAGAGAGSWDVAAPRRCRRAPLTL